MTAFLKRGLADALWATLGRRNFVRLGRFLWMQARLDVVNDPRQNGELLVLRALARRLAGGSDPVVLDVGANLGEWSESFLKLLFAAQGDISHRASTARPRLHLFEPAPATRALLTRRGLAVRYPKAVIEIVPMAVGDRNGTAELAVFDERDGIHTLSPVAGDVPKGLVEVTCTTLDAYCSAHGIDRVDYLKVDTEGNDFNVLRGAEALLREGRVRYLQFEYNHRWIAFRRFLKDAFDLLEPFGYHVGKITGRGIDVYSGWHHELESFREGNYLAWRGDALDLELPSVEPWLDAANGSKR